MSDIEDKITAIHYGLKSASDRLQVVMLNFDKKILEYDVKLKTARDAHKAVLKEVDARSKEVNALREENDRLKNQVEQLTNARKPDAISVPPPKHFVVNGEKWGVQYKQVGKYKYIYLYKRINKKLHQFNVGKIWDEDIARMKLAKYKADKKLILNR